MSIPFKLLIWEENIELKIEVKKQLEEIRALARRLAMAEKEKVKLLLFLKHWCGRFAHHNRPQALSGNGVADARPTCCTWITGYFNLGQS